MTRDELLRNLAKLVDMRDYEVAHIYADQALLDYIKDKEIEDAFKRITRHYA